MTDVAIFPLKRCHIVARILILVVYGLEICHGAADVSGVDGFAEGGGGGEGVFLALFPRLHPRHQSAPHVIPRVFPH